MHPRLSVFFPMYNEEDNLPIAVQRATEVLAEIAGDDYEIVIVNDASTDRTGELAEELAAADPHLRPIHHLVNRSLGGAIQTGLAESRGDFVLYIDGDLPCDLNHLTEALPLLEEADLAIGYRVGRWEGVLRWLYSRAYNCLVRWLLKVRARDVNCPFKVFRRELVQRLHPTSTSGFIDAEILAETRRLGYRIVEMPVLFTPRVAGVSTLARPAKILEILRDLRTYLRRRRKGGNYG